jgi:hypothetical protein
MSARVRGSSPLSTLIKGVRRRRALSKSSTGLTREKLSGQLADFTKIELATLHSDVSVVTVSPKICELYLEPLRNAEGPVVFDLRMGKRLRKKGFMSHEIAQITKAGYSKLSELHEATRDEFAPLLVAELVDYVVGLLIEEKS